MANYGLYNKSPRYVLGFHGCDKHVADSLLSTNKPDFQESKNEYDWLGNGMYFWENDPYRAEQFINEKKEKRKNIKIPTVIGAVIDLGYCLNLVESYYIKQLDEAYNALVEISKIKKIAIPENKKLFKNDPDNVLRYLDKAVIHTLFSLIEFNEEVQKFDSVRGMFLEGGPVYEGAGFHKKTHVQIAIRNPEMIKGYFLPIHK